jgi:hypothetical protein
MSSTIRKFNEENRRKSVMHQRQLSFAPSLDSLGGNCSVSQDPEYAGEN